MTLGRRFARVLLAASVTAAGLVASSSPARAVFHLMKVVEVFAGTAAEANADFVELQMFSPGQRFVGGHLLHLYGAPIYPGVPSSRTDCTIPANVADGSDQARILFATTQAQSTLPTSADFTLPPLLSGGGGAVCFENIDCVSWGSFDGSTTHPSGTPEPTGIPADQSIHRDLKGNSTLEPADDTNDSATDFSPGSQSASPNGPTILGTLTCQAGTGGGGTGGGYEVQNLRARVRGNRATVSGRIQPPAPGEAVSLAFFANGSPLRRIATKRATLNAEGEFAKRFRVPSESTRCKVKVRFRGVALGQKGFRC